MAITRASSHRDSTASAKTAVNQRLSSISHEQQNPGSPEPVADPNSADRRGSQRRVRISIDTARDSLFDSAESSPLSSLSSARVRHPRSAHFKSPYGPLSSDRGDALGFHDVHGQFRFWDEGADGSARTSVSMPLPPALGRATRSSQQLRMRQGRLSGGGGKGGRRHSSDYLDTRPVTTIEEKATQIVEEEEKEEEEENYEEEDYDEEENSGDDSADPDFAAPVKSRRATKLATNKALTRVNSEHRPSRASIDRGSQRKSLIAPRFTYQRYGLYRPAPKSGNSNGGDDPPPQKPRLGDKVNVKRIYNGRGANKNLEAPKVEGYETRWDPDYQNFAQYHEHPPPGSRRKRGQWKFFPIDPDYEIVFEESCPPPTGIVGYAPQWYRGPAASRTGRTVKVRSSLTADEDAPTVQYHVFQPLPDWRTKDLNVLSYHGHRFMYTRDGYLEKGLRFTPQTMKAFIKHHPLGKSLVLRLQRHPYAAQQRFINSYSTVCRSAKCEHMYNKLRVGQDVVAIDELSGRLPKAQHHEFDPYFAAGFLHTRCLEQLVDLRPLLLAGVLQLDIRRNLINEAPGPLRTNLMRYPRTDGVLRIVLDYTKFLATNPTWNPAPGVFAGGQGCLSGRLCLFSYRLPRLSVQNPPPGWTRQEVINWRNHDEKHPGWGGARAAGIDVLRMDTLIHSGRADEIVAPRHGRHGPQRRHVPPPKKRAPQNKPVKKHRPSVEELQLTGLSCDDYADAAASRLQKGRAGSVRPRPAPYRIQTVKARREAAEECARLLDEAAAVETALEVARAAAFAEEAALREKKERLSALDAALLAAPDTNAEGTWMGAEEEVVDVVGTGVETRVETSTEGYHAPVTRSRTRSRQTSTGNTVYAFQHAPPSHASSVCGYDASLDLDYNKYNVASLPPVYEHDYDQQYHGHDQQHQHHGHDQHHDYPQQHDYHHQQQPQSRHHSHHSQQHRNPSVFSFTDFMNWEPGAHDTTTDWYSTWFDDNIYPHDNPNSAHYRYSNGGTGPRPRGPSLNFGGDSFQALEARGEDPFVHLGDAACKTCFFTSDYCQCPGGYVPGKKSV